MEPSGQPLNPQPAPPQPGPPPPPPQFQPQPSPLPQPPPPAGPTPPLTPGGYDQTMMQPPPAPPKKSFLKNRNSMWLFAAIFALIGGITTLLLFANQKSNIEYFWYGQRFDEGFWDDKIHTNNKECLNNQFICHDNGTLVLMKGTERAWQSDPKKNSTDKKLKSPTWSGPYLYASGPYNGYGFGITGMNQVCFTLKDVSPRGTTARITLQVHNAAAYGQKEKTLTTVQGNLVSDFRKQFLPVCVQYYNSSDAYAQQYRVYVQKGTVQIDYVEHFTEYYLYDYTPYPYDYVSKSVNAKAPNAQKAHSGAICSATLKKATSKCRSASEMNKAQPSSRLTETQLNPADVTAE